MKNAFIIGAFLALGLLAQADISAKYTTQKDSALVTIGAPGTVFMTAAATCPGSSFPADGRAVSRSTYGNLFAALGTTYGSGDGSTTFNLPDSRGVFVRGAGSQTIASITYTGTRGTAQGDQIQGHVHNARINGALVYQAATGGSGANNQNNTNGFNTGGQLWDTFGPVTDGSNGTPRIGSETRPANIVITYCIKY